MKHFQWTFDRNRQVAWLLDDPTRADGASVSWWHFRKGAPLTIDGALRLSVKQVGELVDASFSVGDVLCLSERLGHAMQALALDQLQLIPACLEGGYELFVANLLKEVDCVDEARSAFTKWAGGSSVRPDKAGEYRSMMRLHVDAQAAGQLDIFVPRGWRVAIIVSERMRACIERVGSRGTEFVAVN